MKHIFCVFSGITSAVSEAVIRHENIDPRDVIIMTSRGHIFPFHKGKHVLELEEYFSGTPTIVPRIKFWKTRSAIGKFDDMLSKAVGREGFTVYLPHAYSAHYQLMLSHRLCRNHCYIEEGLACYQSHRFLASSLNNCIVFNVHNKLCKKVLGGSRLTNRSFYLPTASRAYGVTDRSFQHFNFHTIKVNPAIPDCGDCAKLYDQAAIIVLNWVDDFCVYTKSEYWLSLHRLTRIVDWSLFRKVYIRFNSLNIESDNRFLLEAIFAAIGQKMCIDSNRYSLEQICKCANVSVFSAESSIGLYASLFGRTVFSYSPLICSISNAFEEYYKALTHEIGFELGTRKLVEISLQPDVKRLHEQR